MKSHIIVALVVLLMVGAVGYYAYDYGRQAGIAIGAAGVTGQNAQGGGGFRQNGQAGGFGQNGQANPNAGQAQNGAGGANGPGANRTAGNAAGGLLGGIQGTVQSVDGNTLTVIIARGQQTQTVKVTLAAGGQVEQLATGAPADIKAGTQILIGLNQQAAAGGATTAAPGQAQQIPSEVQARSITILPATGAP
jgi:hypothetical protein